MDSLTAVPTLCKALHGHVPADLVVASPDAGRVKMATEYAHRLHAPVVVLHKRRASGTETAVTHLVGDVRNKPCLIIDDMISTAGTMARAVEVLLEAEARPDIIIAATHGLLLAGSREKLSGNGIGRVFCHRYRQRIA